MHDCGGCGESACAEIECGLDWADDCGNAGDGVGIVDVPGGVCSPLTFTDSAVLPEGTKFVNTSVTVYDGMTSHEVLIEEAGGEVAVLDGDGGLNFEGPITVEYTITTSDCLGKTCLFALTPGEANCVDDEDCEPGYECSESGGCVEIPVANLTANKTASVEKFVVGEPFDYTIEVCNDGLLAAENVIVVDVVGAPAVVGETITSFGEFTEGAWTVGTLEPGACETLVITVTIDEEIDFTNTATATADNAEEVESIIIVSAEPCDNTFCILTFDNDRFGKDFGSGTFTGLEKPIVGGVSSVTNPGNDWWYGIAIKPVTISLADVVGIDGLEDCSYDYEFSGSFADWHNLAGDVFSDLGFSAGWSTGVSPHLGAADANKTYVYTYPFNCEDCTDDPIELVFNVLEVAKTGEPPSVLPASFTIKIRRHQFEQCAESPEATGIKKGCSTIDPCATIKCLPPQICVNGECVDECDPCALTVLDHLNGNAPVKAGENGYPLDCAGEYYFQLGAACSETTPITSAILNLNGTATPLNIGTNGWAILAPNTTTESGDGSISISAEGCDAIKVGADISCSGPSGWQDVGDDGSGGRIFNFIGTDPCISTACPAFLGSYHIVFTNLGSEVSAYNIGSDLTGNYCVNGFSVPSSAIPAEYDNVSVLCRQP